MFEPKITPVSLKKSLDKCCVGLNSELIWKIMPKAALFMRKTVTWHEFYVPVEQDE